jgi:tetratricopeptide (TPR) repeat protein
MIAAGILILLGVVLDFAVHGFSGIHVLFGVCGLFLIIVNSIGIKKLKGGRIGKVILSLAALALTCLIVAGILPSFSSGTAGSTANEIKKAGQMAKEKGTAEASAYLDGIIRKGLWNRDLAFGAAEVFQIYGQFGDAIGRYITILSYVPYDTEVRYALAQSMIGSKNYNGAIEQLAYILQLDPGNADICETLGDSYWAKGDSIRGIYYYKMAVNQAGDRVAKRVKLARAYANMHSDAEAMEQYEKAKELAKTFDEEMLVYNGYTAINGDSSLQEASQEASAEASSQDKEAGQ